MDTNNRKLSIFLNIFLELPRRGVQKSRHSSIIIAQDWCMTYTMCNFPRTFVRLFVCSFSHFRYPFGMVLPVQPLSLVVTSDGVDVLFRK